MIDHDDSTMLKFNYSGMVSKIEYIINAWYNRGLSVLGKVIMLNSLIGSLYIYKISTVCKIPDKIIEQTNSIMREYIWDVGKNKVALHIIQNPKELGGLRLFNLEYKRLCTQMSTDKILEYEEIKELANQYFVCKGSFIWKCNLRVNDVGYFVKKVIWCDVVKAYVKVFLYTSNTKAKILDQPIWMHSFIGIGDIRVFNINAVNKNFYKLKDIMNDDGSFKGYDTVKQRSNGTVSI